MDGEEDPLVEVDEREQEQATGEDTQTNVLDEVLGASYIPQQFTLMMQWPDMSGHCIIAINGWGYMGLRSSHPACFSACHHLVRTVPPPVRTVPPPPGGPPHCSCSRELMAF